MAIVLALAAVTGLLAAKVPQHDPAGVVLDEQGRPIAGASVALRLQAGGGAPFAQSIAASLARSPLPAVRSGRDGTWVLPLTEEQRLLGGPSHGDSGCWLVVEKDGHLDWCEPIPAGLSTYRGSRVLLRRVRTDDPFAAMPWPPAVIAARTERGFLPWLPLAGWRPTFVPTGAKAAADRVAAAPADAPALATLRLVVTAAGTPVPGALLWFDDGAWERAGDAPPLPDRTGADGVASALLPPGARKVRVAATGCVAVERGVALAAGARETLSLELTPAVAVDVLALAADGTAVPFVRVAVIPKVFDERHASCSVFTDASGRVRVMVDEPELWSVYGDDEGPGGTAASTTLDAARDANGFVRIVKHRPVTVLLRGDEWPRRGELRWATGARSIHRSFRFEPAGETAVAFRSCYRETDETWIGGDQGVPFRIRRDDLPPPHGEPLLDLVVLDRTVRQRAVLQPDSDDEFVSGFAVRPSWQREVRHDAELLQQARRVGGRWVLLARDDGPLDLIGVANGLLDAPFVVPARTERGDLPAVPVRLTAR